jgi:hypothetical protein
MLLFVVALVLVPLLALLLVLALGLVLVLVQVLLLVPLLVVVVVVLLLLLLVVVVVVEVVLALLLLLLLLLLVVRAVLRERPAIEGIRPHSVVASLLERLPRRPRSLYTNIHRLDAFHVNASHSDVGSGGSAMK